MCLAIGNATQTRRSPLGHAWWQIAATPERLLPFGASVQAVLLVVVISGNQAAGRASLAYATVTALLAIMNLAASGVLMARFCLWADRSQVHYVRYSSSFALGFAGLLLLEVTLATGMDLLLAATAILATGALVSLRGLSGLYGWVKSDRRMHATVAMIAMWASALLLVALAAYSL